MYLVYLRENSVSEEPFDLCSTVKQPPVVILSSILYNTVNYPFKHLGDNGIHVRFIEIKLN